MNIVIAALKLLLKADKTMVLQILTHTRTHTGKKNQKRIGITREAVSEKNAKSHIELISINAWKQRTPTQRLKSVIIHRPK